MDSEKLYVYFVAYSSVDSFGNQGFGNGSITVNGPVNTYGKVILLERVLIKKLEAEQKTNLKHLKVSNYILLKERDGIGTRCFDCDGACFDLKDDNICIRCDGEGVI